MSECFYFFLHIFELLSALQLFHTVSELIGEVTSSLSHVIF